MDKSYLRNHRKELSSRRSNVMSGRRRVTCSDIQNSSLGEAVRPIGQFLYLNRKMRIFNIFSSEKEIDCT